MGLQEITVVSSLYDDWADDLTRVGLIRWNMFTIAFAKIKRRSICG